MNDIGLLDSRNIEITRVPQTDVGRVLAFLNEQGYTRVVEPDDRHYAARRIPNLEIIATGRLSASSGANVLRGMRVGAEFQRQGVGTRLLRSIAQDLQSEDCYCIPYRWLVRFYGMVGFVPVAPSQVPSFLATRHAKYLAQGADVILMYRPSASHGSMPHV